MDKLQLYAMITNQQGLKPTGDFIRHPLYIVIPNSFFFLYCTHLHNNKVSWLYRSTKYSTLTIVNIPCCVQYCNFLYIVCCWVYPCQSDMILQCMGGCGPNCGWLSVAWWVTLCVCMHAFIQYVHVCMRAFVQYVSVCMHAFVQCVYVHACLCTVHACARGPGWVSAAVPLHNTPQRLSGWWLLSTFWTGTHLTWAANPQGMSPVDRQACKQWL